MNSKLDHYSLVDLFFKKRNLFFVEEIEFLKEVRNPAWISFSATLLRNWRYGPVIADLVFRVCFMDGITIAVSRHVGKNDLFKGLLN